MILLKELFSPFGKRKRFRFFIIHTICAILVILIEILAKKSESYPLCILFLSWFFVLFWILLVNFLKRIRDMKFCVSYCLSKWAFSVLVSWTFCFFFVPSSENGENEKNNPAVKKL
jgi:uncharacterized membrane protein YhaH (DUF805 family)